MNSVIFRLPTSFILERCTPKEDEIKFGVIHGWLTREDAEAVIAAVQERGGQSIRREIVFLDPLTQAELNDEAVDMDGRVQDLEATGEWAKHPARLWMFLALEWLYVHRDQPGTELAPSKTAKDFGEEDNYPLGIIAMVYCDFWHPREIERLIYYMPAQAGELTGREALQIKWESFLKSARHEFTSR
jgi:hypothetical protein